MAELDQKLSEAAVGRGGAKSDEIEDRLSDIATRVGRTEQQLGSLETIERAVNQLFDSMEQQRTWTQDVADSAANRVAQQFMAQAPQSVSLGGAPEIQALQDGLQAVRAAADGAETRNQETLEAVHETLEHIVSKLSELETATIGQRVAAAVAAPIAAAQVYGNPLEEQQEQTHEWADPEPTLTVNNPFATADELAAPHDPLLSEPPVEAVNPFDAIVENSRIESELSSLESAAAVGGDDFIAAARRAAQAAVTPKSMLSGIAPGAARMSEETSKKILNLGFLKAKKKTKAAAPAPGLTGELKHPPGFKPANTNNDTKKRKYIIMGIALLAAVSVFTFNMLGQAKKAKTPAQPTAIEQQLAQQQTCSGHHTAQPPQAKPAELESMLVPEGADPVLTGSIEQAGQTNMAALIEGSASAAEDLPPANAGSMQLREAAAMGNAEAQFIIATRYLNGEDGVVQDFAKAAYWYGKAAATGNAPAQYRLGTLYERGKGVARDMNAALGWYERSAALGNVKAMHNAAVLSAGNEQREPDYARAFKWFSLGAAHGLKDSQFNLAVLLERGLGTKANAKEALFWYSMAAKQSDAEAGKRSDKIAKTLPPADLQVTEKRLRNWTPEIAPDAANTIAVRDAAWNAAAPDAG